MKRYVRKLAPEAARCGVMHSAARRGGAGGLLPGAPDAGWSERVSGRRPWVFRMTLCHSRHGYEEAVWDQKLETFLRLHENAFRESRRGAQGRSPRQPEGSGGTGMSLRPRRQSRSMLPSPGTGASRPCLPAPAIPRRTASRSEAAATSRTTPSKVGVSTVSPSRTSTSSAGTARGPVADSRHYPPPGHRSFSGDRESRRFNHSPPSRSLSSARRAHRASRRARRGRRRLLPGPPASPGAEDPGAMGPILYASITTRPRSPSIPAASSGTVRARARGPAGQTLLSADLPANLLARCERVGHRS